jgi:NAD(P)-dependent dehydrogenase (short-subunit alcohol dehydrogenase family)/aryl carrier-like protein
VAARTSERVLAYRGRQRWTQDFEPVRLAAGAAPPLRPGCVCLVTGGLGGVGQALARWLARAGARLVLVGRSELPPRERRDQLLLAAWGEAGGGQPPLPPRQARLLRQLRRWRELEEDGAEVLWVTADVTDRTALARVREQVHASFGALHGVVHAAGVPGGGILQLRRREEAAAVLAPKVQGTLALAEVFRPEELDFFVLCSSLNSVLGAVGQADYCAANAFIDAFAASRSSRSSRPGALAGRVLSIAWDRWDEAGMAAEAAPPLGPRSTALPDLPGEAIAHPLLDRRLPEQAGRQTFVTRFSAERHWVLAEHRLDGMPVLPGTAFLELARAACALADGEVRGAGNGDGAAGVEIRTLSFVAPLPVPDHETCDVFTTLRRAGDAWEVRIASRAPDSGWREHALGEVAPLAAPPAPAGRTPPALSDLLAAMQLAPLAAAAADAAAVLPAPPAPLGATGDPGAGTAAAAADRADFRLTLGPRWQGVVRAVAAAGDELLARLELPARFAADLDALALHPALLDLATGFVHAAADATAPYLPFSYAGLRLVRALPAVVYSHARRLADTVPAASAADGPVHPAPPAPRSPAEAATLRYAVTLYDAAGEVLLTIDEYAFRRVDPHAFLATVPPALAPAAPAAPAAELRNPTGPAPAESAGMSSSEGMEVFGRILARMTLPQVLVSTRDLRARAAAAAADTGERLLAELADLATLGAPKTVAAGERHPRPALGVPFAPPRDAAEERLAEVWQELLGIERIGVNDDFFELGGDSVLGLRIAALARERGIVLSPNELFTHPTIAALARHVPPSPAPAATASVKPGSEPGPGAGPNPSGAGPNPSGAGPNPSGGTDPAAGTAGHAGHAVHPAMHAVHPAGQPATVSPDDFPDAEVSPRDLAALLAQLDPGGG